jgi:hypothetical protein
MPMAPKHGSEGYVGVGTTLAMHWGWSPYADLTKTFTKGYLGRFSQKFQRASATDTLSAYLNDNLRHDGTVIPQFARGKLAVIIRWSYLPSFLPAQCPWKLLQLAIFFAFASGTYTRP